MTTSLVWEPWLRKELEAIEKYQIEKDLVNYDRAKHRSGRKPKMFLDKLFMFRVHYGTYGHVKNACEFADISFRYAKSYMTKWGMVKSRELQGHRFHRKKRGFYLREEPIPIMDLVPRWKRPKELKR